MNQQDCIEKQGIKFNKRKDLLVFLASCVILLALCQFTLLGSAVSDLQELAMIPEVRSDLEALRDLPRYKIHMKMNLDQESPGFQGEETITFINGEEIILENLYLRLYPNGHKTYGNGSLNLIKVLVAGREVHPVLTVEETVVEVPLQEPLPPGGQVKLEVEFEGEISKDFAGVRFNYGVYNYTQGVMTLANWYPILAVYDDEGWNLDPVYGWGDAVYSDVGLYEVSISTPAKTVVATSGFEVPGKSSQNGNATTHFYVSGPTRDFFIALSRDFQVLKREVGDTVVNCYFLPGKLAVSRAALEVSATALEVFDRLFGLYPYVELDVLVLPLPFTGGVEYPGIILLSDGLFSDLDDTISRSVVAHEVAHQWWYGVVGSDVIDEPWLDEALATYSSALYIEETLGKTCFEGVLADWQERYTRARAAGTCASITSPVTSFTSNSDYTPIVYYGGALFYHALRERIGDEAFFEGLREYYRQFRYKIATTEKLLTLFEEVSGEELDDLYEEWLFAEGIIILLESKNLLFEEG